MKALKFLFVLFLSFGLLINCYADDDDDITPEITSLRYSGNLNIDTTVEINGENLGECSLLVVDGKVVPFTKSSETKITYKYKDSNSVYKGNLQLTCGAKTLSKSIAFPYINEIQVLENHSRQIYINGANFYDSPTVHLESGSFTIKTIMLSSILGELPEDFPADKLEVYVTSNGNQSNVIDIPINILHIDYLKTNDYFGIDEKMQICGQYLKSSDSIYIDSEKYNGTKSFADNCFEVTIPELNKSEIEVYVQNEEFISNKIDFSLVGYKPIIENVTEINEGTTDNPVYKLRVTGKNFGDNASSLKANINGKSVNVVSAEDELVILGNYSVSRDKNFVQIEALGNYSNIFEFKVGATELEIYSYEIGELDEDGNREVRINLGGTIDKSRQEIRLDSTELEIKTTFLNSIKVLIPATKMTGYLGVYTGDEQVSNNYYYDARERNLLYLKKVVFEEEREPNADFYIEGENLFDATISTSNLIDKDKQEYSPIRNSGTKISTILGRDYSPTSNSSVSLSKNGVTTSYTFGEDELVNNEVYFPPEIYSVETEEAGIQQGDIIKINGRGFEKTDVINFGNVKTYVIQSKTYGGDYIYTKVPDGVEGQVNLSISRVQNELKSKNYSIIVLSDLDDRDIAISLKNPSTVKKFKTFSVDDNLVSEYSVINKLDDLLVDEIEFKVEGYDDRSNIGSFKLNIGGKDYPVQVINTSGNIVFKNVIIPKSISEQTISLYKNSAFILADSFSISLTKINGKNIFNENISDYVDIVDNKKQVEIVVDLGVTCVDSESDQSHCNKLFLEDDNSSVSDDSNEDNSNENIENTETENSSDSNEENMTTLEKADKVIKILEKFVNKKSNGNTTKKITIYKAFQVELEDMYKRYINEEVGTLIKLVINKIKIKITVLQ